VALTHILLFFHLLGAICFFAGGAVVGVLQLAAIRQEKPSEVYALLRLAPFGAALVGSGALLTLGFGIGLAEHEGLGLSPAWIEGALGLWVAAMALGGYGGRTARHARHLAERLVAEADAPSPELRALVAARGPLMASYASMLCLLAILALMVWQPGAPSTVIPPALKKAITGGDPRLAYVPTRVPAGYAVSEYAYFGTGYRIVFTRNRAAVTDMDFLVETLSSCAKQPTGAQQRLRVDGHVLRFHYGEDGQQIWECRNGVLREADSYPSGYPTKPHDLATLVAYAEPLR